MNTASETIANPTEGLNQGLRMAPESIGLEPTSVGPFVIGSHSDLNGEGAELLNFKPTRDELRTLAYHYLDRYFSVQENFHICGCSGSWEWRESLFSSNRFQSIAETLGKGLIKEFEDYIKKKWDEIDEVRLEVEREMASGTGEDRSTSP